MEPEHRKPSPENVRKRLKCQILMPLSVSDYSNTVFKVCVSKKAPTRNRSVWMLAAMKVRLVGLTGEIGRNQYRTGVRSGKA